MTTQKKATPLDLPAPLVKEEIGAFYSTEMGFNVYDMTSGYGINIDHANCALMQHLELSQSELQQCIGAAAYRYSPDATLHNMLLLTKATQDDITIAPKEIAESCFLMEGQHSIVINKFTTVEEVEGTAAVVRFIHYGEEKGDAVERVISGYPRITDYQLEHLLRTQPEMTDRIINYVTERGYERENAEDSFKALTDYLASETETALSGGWL